LLLDDKTSEGHDLQLQSIVHGVVSLEHLALDTAPNGDVCALSNCAAHAFAAATTTSISKLEACRSFRA
jgi:hypothetical protein